MPDPFRVVATEELTLDAEPPLSEMFVLSPYVWLDADGFHLAVRAVPDSERAEEKIAVVYHGRSEDGLRFAMDPQPAIAPGPEPDDRDGCEDPTVVPHEGHLHVFYSGWNGEEKHGRLLVAVGAHAGELEKRGRVLPESERYRDTKEVALGATPDGRLRLFFEYAHEDASKIGVASAASLEGPWAFEPSIVEARQGRWDGWHLSPGPIVRSGSDRPLMFYNGATRDAHWRIGWVALGPGCDSVVARSGEPLIEPPPTGDDSTDIAFAASAVERDGEVLLYYSLSDKRLLRARLEPT